jgi:uncharacterized protein
MSFPPRLPLRRSAGWAQWCLLTLAFIAGAAGAEPAATGKIFLWEVKSSTNSVYLFGSLHVAREDFYPLPKAVEEAYRKADELVVEIDITDTARMAETFSLLTYAPPDSLDHHLSPEVWKQVEAASKQTQQDVTSLKPLKPATLASMLALTALAAHGYDPQAGIDLHFLTAAHADGKRIVELETPEYQARILGGLNDADAQAMLSETLEEMRTDDLVRATDELAAAWKAGDEPSVARLLRETNKDEASKKIFARLFDERNPVMADKIAALASSSERALVVIGAGHLAGDNSVVELLRAKGLRVRQLP